jgi:phage-related protein
MSDPVKPVQFRGSALTDLRSFPADARRKAGFQLDQVQHGRDPDDWKPMGSVGSGIRIQEDGDAFRVMYVAKLGDAIYVLHCFQKKTQKTSRNDLTLAARRYRELVKELEE